VITITKTIQSDLSSLVGRNKNTMLIAVRSWFYFAHKQIRHDLTHKFIKDITSELSDWGFIEERGREMLKPATLKIMQTGGNNAYKLLQVKGAFDVLNVNAVTAAEKFTAELVREVTKKTKMGIRTYIKTGIKEGRGMPKIARELRPLVGLTENQTQSIINYRRLLEDKEKYPKLKPADIDKKVQRYAGKTHRRRAATIARTETARAQNIGYVQGLEDVGVTEVEFSASPGACGDCLALDETRYSAAEAKGIIPVHPNCRCAMLPVVNDLPPCQGSPGEVANASCIMPDKLHDGQVQSLLNKLEEAGPAESSKISRALRKLGHKGGLSGKPPVGKIPTVKPTKPVVAKPKVRHRVPNQKIKG